MIKIEKGLPVPKTATRTAKYPFKEMVLGDSFFVKDEVDAKRMQQRVAAAACMFVRKNPGYKFKTQASPEGVRLWRVL